MRYWWNYVKIPRMDETLKHNMYVYTQSLCCIRETQTMYESFFPALFGSQPKPKKRRIRNRLIVLAPLENIRSLWDQQCRSTPWIGDLVRETIDFDQQHGFWSLIPPIVRFKIPCVDLSSQSEMQCSEGRWHHFLQHLQCLWHRYQLRL